MQHFKISAERQKKHISIALPARDSNPGYLNIFVVLSDEIIGTTAVKHTCNGRHISA